MPKESESKISAMKEEFLKTEDACNKSFARYKKAGEEYDKASRRYDEASEEWHRLINKHLKLWVACKRLDPNFP